MEKRKIVVTGANGQLGRELQAIAGARSTEGQPASLIDRAWTIADFMATDVEILLFPFEFLFLSKEDLPIQDAARTLQFFERHRPDYCINCAAYTAVDKAESEKDLAFAINGDAVGSLAAACKRVGARLIHISTDYVFDGHSDIPLKENDPTGPINIYGASKLKGEQLARQENPDTVIIRTSWVYSEFGNNFVKTMMRLMREKERISVVDDQIGSPTYAADLAAVIGRIVSGGIFVPGLYHYSNEGQISWFDFAQAIKEGIHSSCTVVPIPTAQYPTPAKRPKYSLLDSNLIKATYGITIPEWRQSLTRCLAKIASPGSSGH
ncbi:MAG TPA: dTDP-4-dehydrorhamnose reductase [Puia sp.]|nr:dTDP-4-dehydrorhamnose reductase [Puia sp.]